jgi:predicted GNAT family N-acyltransferase
MLALRHLRIGFWGLLLFLSFGLGLEALHGYKVAFYLAVENEPRRLAWRLAHAHGTLLSLVNVVFGLTLGSRYAPPAAAAERASRLLTAATLLLPGGFLLGGAFVHGGDPGLGVLLVPLGALALFGAVWITARGLTGERANESPDGGSGSREIVLREISFGTAEYEASVALRTRVLRDPLRLYPTPEEREEDRAERHLGAFEGTRLVGCLVLHDLGDGRVRMRQVAVDFDRQRRGLGNKLVRYSESFALGLGFREMRLHARRTAVPFYERLGYESYGEPFVEVTLPHLAMKKALHPSG